MIEYWRLPDSRLVRCLCDNMQYVIGDCIVPSPEYHNEGIELAVRQSVEVVSDVLGLAQ